MGSGIFVLQFLIANQDVGNTKKIFDKFMLG